MIWPLTFLISAWVRETDISAILSSLSWPRPILKVDFCPKSSTCKVFDW